MCTYAYAYIHTYIQVHIDAYIQREYVCVWHFWPTDSPTDSLFSTFLSLPSCLLVYSIMHVSVLRIRNKVVRALFVALMAPLIPAKF
jgi:hypothetical protein